MHRTAKVTSVIAISAFTLTACTDQNGRPLNNTNDGLLIGGALGAIAGAFGKKPKVNSIVTGAVVGAAIGGLIGQELDRQEAALRANIASGDVVIVNTGTELVVVLPEAITFDTGSDFVRDTLLGDLQVLAENLNEFPNTTADIIGHTDNVGAASFNQELSARRANAVSAILLEDGVDPGRIRAFGRGEDEPKATNLSEEGRAANRRVEIIIRPIG